MIWPQPFIVGRLEQLRIAAGTVVGIGTVALVTGYLMGWAAPANWLLAPLGASAVLVFAAPTSPMAQPWPVLGGNLVSLLIGYALAGWITPPLIAIGAAIGCAMGAMLLLRCPHPPGGAMALVAAMLHQTGGTIRPGIAFLDSILLLAAAVLYHRLTGSQYPARHAKPSADPIRSADIQVVDAALKRLDHYVDVDRDELLELLKLFRRDAANLRLTQMTAADIMATPLVTIDARTSLEQAWRIMRRRKIKVLPVLDASGSLLGLVSRMDLLRVARHPGRGALLASLGRWSPALLWRRVQAGDVMSRDVRAVPAQLPVGELLPVFASTGHHHLPVIDRQGRPVGMITQRDVLKALAPAG